MIRAERFAWDHFHAHFCFTLRKICKQNHFFSHQHFSLEGAFHILMGGTVFNNLAYFLAGMFSKLNFTMVLMKSWGPSMCQEFA